MNTEQFNAARQEHGEEAARSMMARSIGGRGNLKQAKAKARKDGQRLAKSIKRNNVRLAKLTQELVHKEEARCSDMPLAELKTELLGRLPTVHDAAKYQSLVEKSEFVRALAEKRVSSFGLSIENILDITEGVALYDAFPHDYDSVTLDRRDPNGPHAQKWAEGKAPYYVGTDIAKIRISMTDMKQGQYHQAPQRPGHKAKWVRFNNAKDPEYPGNRGGFDATVIDTDQPGSQWALSGQLHTMDFSWTGMPHTITSLAYLYISRSDFHGFVNASDEKMVDKVALSKDQIRGHYKIADLPPLDTGRILIADLCNLSKAEPNTLKKKRFGDEFDRETDSGVVDGTGGISVDTPGDGCYPINVHRDDDGKIDLITIQMMISEGIMSPVGENEGNFCTMLSQNDNRKPDDDWVHPMRKELERKRISGFSSGEPEHLVIPVAYPTGEKVFLYTHGVGGTPKVEFFADDVPMSEVEKMMRTFNFLAMRHKEGHEVRHMGGIQVGEDILISMAVPSELNNKLLESHATACDKDKQLMVIMPRDTLASSPMDVLMDLHISALVATSLDRFGIGCFDKCLTCGAREGEEEGKKLRRCNGCEKVVYCSKECQRSDWTNHKMVCKRG